MPKRRPGCVSFLDGDPAARVRYDSISRGVKGRQSFDSFYSRPFRRLRHVVKFHCPGSHHTVARTVFAPETAEFWLWFVNSEDRRRPAAFVFPI